MVAAFVGAVAFELEYYEILATEVRAS